MCRTPERRGAGDIERYRMHGDGLNMVPAGEKHSKRVPCVCGRLGSVNKGDHECLHPSGLVCITIDSKAQLMFRCHLRWNATSTVR